MMGKRIITLVGFICLTGLALSLPSDLFAEVSNNPSKGIEGVWTGGGEAWWWGFPFSLTVNVTVAPTNDSSGRSFNYTTMLVAPGYYMENFEPYPYHGEGFFTGPDTFECTFIHHNGIAIGIGKIRGRVLDNNTLAQNMVIRIYDWTQDADNDGMPDPEQLPYPMYGIISFENTMVHRVLPDTVTLEFPEYPEP